MVFTFKEELYELIEDDVDAPKQEIKDEEKKEAGKSKDEPKHWGVTIEFKRKKVENISEINFRTATDYLWVLFNQLP